MKVQIMVMLLFAMVMGGCSFGDPEEKAIEEMLMTFVAAIQQYDEVLAKALLLDLDGFKELNPDVAARVDAEGFTETVLAELIHTYRDLADYFDGRDLKFERMVLGNSWYQHKGRQAFKDTEIVITADGEEVDIFIKGLVKIDNRWRIVELSGIDFLQ